MAVNIARRVETQREAPMNRSFLPAPLQPKARTVSEGYPFVVLHLSGDGRLVVRLSDGGLRPLPEQDVRRHLALSLDDDSRALLDDKPVFDTAIYSLADLDRAGRGVSNHPAHSNDGVSPEVVAELGTTED